MTTKEAIEELENGEWWDLIGEVSCDTDAAIKFHAALDIAITALSAQPVKLDTHEWSDGEQDHIYCMGWVNLMTEELLEECQRCPDHVNKAQADFDKHRRDAP